MVFAAFGVALSGQPLNWGEDSPSDFIPIVLRGEFDFFTEGSRALKVEFEETGTPYFVSDTFDVTADTPFTFSIDILENDPGVEVNQRVRFIDDQGQGTNLTSPVFTTDSAGYKTYTFADTSTADAVKAYVIIRIYDVSDNWDGSGEFWLDNASYSEDGGATNLIVNGGFEEWATPVFEPGSVLLDWMEDSPSDFIPIVVEPETGAMTHGLVSAKITFEETGTPYFVSDTFAVNPMDTFTFNIDILDNDAGAEINQRIRFIDEEGDGANVTSDVYSTDNAEFQTYSLSGMVPDTAVQAYVIIRIYDVSASWTGSATFWLDNARYMVGQDTLTNYIPNGSFEEWMAPSGKPEFLSYSFEGLDPMVEGDIDKMAHTVSLTVPFATDETSLVATYTLTEGATAKVGDVAQESGVTANDFTSPVTYTLEADTLTQDWVVTVTEEAASTGNDIVTFRLEGLDPAVNGVVSAADHTVAVEVPSGTDVTALVPTIAVSENATLAPESGVAQDFTSPVTYTVTAQDGTAQDWVVTVTVATAGKTVLFSEDFEDLLTIPDTWVIINNDGHPQAEGEERWQDSAWVVTTSGRPELAGTKVAMASSYVTMENTERVDDWMILPAVELGGNTTLSWQAMSTTSSGNYPDDYMVLIAPAVDGVTPTISYFESEANIVIEVAPESWSATVGRPGEGLSSYDINLKELITPSAPDGWYDQKVWIAFVLITDLYTNPETGVPNAAAGGSNLAVDNIMLVNDASTGIPANGREAFGLSVFPNPSMGQVSVRMTGKAALEGDLLITDVIGKVVYRTPIDRTTGQDRIDLDLSHLQKGIYFLKASVDGEARVTRLVLQ